MGAIKDALRKILTEEAERTGPDEWDADLCIKDGFNLAIAHIHTGDVESSNALCEEICRRFNEFPKEQKR